MLDAMIDALNPLNGEDRAAAFTEITRSLEKGYFEISPVQTTSTHFAGSIS
jgi:hypothetical protein